jgi:aryl-alcohol dehydrogenase-like predicted oxidoreductase
VTITEGDLGETGLVVSAIGLGCNNFGSRLDYEGTRTVIATALDFGINFFDTADIYGDGNSEAYIGRLLKGRREEVVIATKFGWGNGVSDGVPRGSSSAIKEALRGSLRRLKTDYIDLYYYHRPDGVTPVEETLTTLTELVNGGTVRAFGSSNFNYSQLLDAERTARRTGTGRCLVLQNEYNLLERSAERDVLPLCRAKRIAFIPYRPLASGLLTGKYNTGTKPPPGTRLDGQGATIDETTAQRLQHLDRIARKRGRTLLELSFALLASRPEVPSIIAGAMTPEQVRENVASASWRLTDEELRLLDGERGDGRIGYRAP